MEELVLFFSHCRRSLGCRRSSLAGFGLGGSIIVSRLFGGGWGSGGVVNKVRAQESWESRSTLFFFFVRYC